VDQVRGKWTKVEVSLLISEPAQRVAIKIAAVGLINYNFEFDFGSKFIIFSFLLRISYVQTLPVKLWLSNTP
jgi:hypothetical protein